MGTSKRRGRWKSVANRTVLKRVLSFLSTHDSKAAPKARAEFLGLGERILVRGYNYTANVPMDGTHAHLMFAHKGSPPSSSSSFCQ